ncbi:hypothetical protein ABFS82_06G136200 [Erythranthe guttata]|uniref:Uncharacterized protein n=1 Tax=Erythranthe guttata TaxID=4155 RepID=A0A022RQQ2_ERYGU|nr:PREDICTED: uncharacterized protein LOC105953619 [Erythranthe guttata]EYU41270.1 hypothetical protein MIMGU_mgv1a005490mg [Erythranthe guttata]EYU41271.1 hypothetical protein MIMGU_mgv1a005490mg [Erythranthe guttata]|eukprot:XP_012832748.1 PREDICTED: uncharacterized protein LOC105953619 [Erythranthe guttata]
MWLKAVPSIVECSHHGFLLPPSPPPPLPLPPPLSSNLFPRTKIISTTTRGRTIRRSCSSNIDGDIYHGDSPFKNVEQLPKGGPAGSPDSSTNEDHHHHLQGGTISNNKRHCSLSKNNINSPFTDDKHMKDRDSFLHSRFDFLEPMMLGIKPEFPDWSDRESVVIEQKAKSFDIPLSLRMIKKKLQLEDGLCRDTSDCSVKAAFASMVFIIVELQSHALHMREALCDEDLDVISSKVQKEMHSSFVWLFQQVFSKTPAFMLQVMILLADFSVHSASNNIHPSTPSFDEEKQSQYHPPPRIEEQTQIEKTSSYIGGDNHTNVKDLNLWSSMVEDASEMMREGDIEEELVVPKHFVAPVWVEIEPDDYEEFTRTDLLYQMNLSLQPDHPLLLCNYGQFLHRVAHDHDRAEECFKRAVQLSPGDAECLSRYADFLWIVRGEDTIAEEMFLEAMAIEQHNSYYYAMYARFLWRTGGDETCFLLNPNT